MNINIEIKERKVPYGDNNTYYSVSIKINGQFFKEVYPDSDDFKNVMKCIEHSLNNDPDFKFKK